MGYVELIERLQSLPREKQAEVFDFVEFLVARSGLAAGKSIDHVDWRDAEFSAMSMQQAMRGIEDDPVVYTRDDLRERWQ